MINFDDEEGKRFRKALKLLKKIIKDYKNPNILLEINEFPINNKNNKNSKIIRKLQESENQSNELRKMKEKPKRKPLKKQYLPHILPHLLEILEIKDLLILKNVNQYFNHSITAYLKEHRLVKEETLLVQRVFALDSEPNIGFSLQELKEFCVFQIPMQGKHLISLNYQEISSKIENFTKNHLKDFRDFKKTRKIELIDKIFKPFCHLFNKKPIFIRNEEGVSKESWFTTFKKLSQSLILKPEVRNLNYFIERMDEDNFYIMMEKMENYENMEIPTNISNLIEMYKTMLSAYFNENPFTIRTTQHKTPSKIEDFIRNINKNIILLNFARRILGITERMKIILDFSNIIMKIPPKTRNFMLSEEINEKLLGFLGNNQLLKIRLVSKVFKKHSEKILDIRVYQYLRFLPENFIRIIGILSNPSKDFFPRNMKEFNIIKKNPKLFQIFMEIFQNNSVFEDFQNSFEIPHKLRLFALKKNFLKKIQEYQFDKTNNFIGFELLLKALKILYFGFNIDENPNIYELINIIDCFDGLPKNPFPEENIRIFLKNQEEALFEKPMKIFKEHRKKVIFHSSENNLIIIKNIIPFMNFKELYIWGLVSKQSKEEVCKMLENRIILSKNQLNMQESRYKTVINRLFHLRKRRKSDNNLINPTEELLYIEELSDLNNLEIKDLKSLNKFPKKYELFLKPFLLLLPPIKNTKLHSFQCFLKRKDLITSINSLNFELISSETIFLLEKFLFEYREFFKETYKKRNIYDKFACWLKALVNFYSIIRKFHISYEESLNLRLSDSHLEIIMNLDILMENIYKYMKLSEIFMNFS